MLTILICAILRNINHIWFNRLSKEKQAEINKLFQEYKAQLDKERPVLIATTISSEKIEKPIKIDLDIDTVEDCIIIPVYDYTEKEYEYAQSLIKKYKITLTDKGHMLSKEILSAFNRAKKVHLDKLTQEDFVMLSALVEKLQ